MKRDMDLVRKILLFVEESPERKVDSIELDYFNDVIYYHVKLMLEAGLLHATNTSHADALRYQSISLTWAGHEFLELSRDNTIWEKAKDLVSKKTSGLGFAILSQILTKIAEQAVLGP